MPLFCRLTFAPETALCEGSSTRTRKEPESVWANSAGANASKSRRDNVLTSIRLYEPSYIAASVPWRLDENPQAPFTNRRRRCALCSQDTIRSNGGILLAALLAVAPALNIISTDTAGNIRGVNNTGNPTAANSYVVTYLTGHGAFGGLMLSFAGLIDDGAARPAAT